MMQLTTPLSSAEIETLLACISEQEHHLLAKQSHSSQDLMKRTTLASAREKVKAQTFDCFFREEITTMVFALDSLSRHCIQQLSENTSADNTDNLSLQLRTAASTRTKLVRAVHRR